MDATLPWNLQREELKSRYFFDIGECHYDDPKSETFNKSLSFETTHKVIEMIDEVEKIESVGMSIVFNL